MSNIAENNGKAAMEVQKVRKGNKDHGALTITTLCKPKRFLQTISTLSKQKRRAVSRLGFGALCRLRCTKLKRPICQMLAENFDPSTSSLKIHGKSIPVSYLDFERLTGVKDGGQNLTFDGSLDEPHFTKLVKIISGDKDVITLDQLESIINDRVEADDIFQIAFSFYILVVLLCPGSSDILDMSLLLPLGDSITLPLNNWASFSFDFLVGGLRSFKKNPSEYVCGCLLFLQLFYFDALASKVQIVDKEHLPVAAWGDLEGEQLLGWVEQHGGLNSTEIFESDEVDNIPADHLILPRLGLPPATRNLIVEDLSRMEAILHDVNGNFANVGSTLTQVESVYHILFGKVAQLEISFAEFKNDKDDIIRQVVLKVLEMLNVGSDGTSKLNEQMRNWVNESKRKSSESEGGMKKKRSMDGSGVTPLVVSESNPDKAAQKLPVLVKATVGGDKQLNKEDINCSANLPILKAKSQTTRGHDADHVRRLELSPISRAIVGFRGPPRQRVTFGPFSLKRAPSTVKASIISFLFDGIPFVDPSVAVASEGDVTVTRGYLSCLAPDQLVEDNVISLWAEYLSAANVGSWYFRMYFGVRAAKYVGGVNAEIYSADTVSQCALERFRLRVTTCTKIFIPMFDELTRHYFLVVVLVVERLYEIWDSLVDEASKARREQFARAALCHLDLLDFWSEFKSYDPNFKFENFVQNHDIPNPQQRNCMDCGIYVINHMQSYKEQWYRDYDTDEQRCKVAVDTVKHQQNQLRGIVRSYIP